VIKSGLTKVPINPRLAEDEREYIAAHAGITVLFADRTTVDHARTIAGKVDSIRE